MSEDSLNTLTVLIAALINREVECFFTHLLPLVSGEGLQNLWMWVFLIIHLGISRQLHFDLLREEEVCAFLTTDYKDKSKFSENTVKYSKAKKKITQNLN